VENVRTGEEAVRSGAVEGAASARVRVRRHSERASYEPAALEAILDEALICHVGVVVDGLPVVLPTLHGRVGRTLYLHGAPANRSLRAALQGVCVTATLLDGLVLARSTRMHSMNYRSAVVIGHARTVSDPEEKSLALRAIVEHAIPGRSAEVRNAGPADLAATAVVAVDLDQCSAKARTGPPLDPEEDRKLPVWAGVVPLRTVAGPALRDPDVPVGVAEPPSVTGLRRRWPGFEAAAAG
jgi:nitroimidazol reductase NimA-like FMN-containing flavoprotein (pyridoxamine 5'-phosphate oxidase superfamily)